MKINFNLEQQFFLSSEVEYQPHINGYLNTALSFDGDLEAQHAKGAVVNTYSVFTNGKKNCTEDGFSVEYELWKRNVKLIEHVKTFENINVIEQYSEVVSGDSEPINLTELCSAVALGVCYDDGKNISKRLCDGSIIVHYCLSKWQTEGQWRSATPEDLGVFNGTNHSWERAKWRIDSISSWSTGTFYPLFIIEDKVRGECWFFEAFSGVNWFMELFCYGGENDCTSLSVKIGGIDECNGFNERLVAGGTISSPKCIYGVTKGSFEDAVAEIIKYKRATANIKEGAPLVFNDYMNCNWGLQSEKRLIRLIDKASEVGAEVFCLDDGWHNGFGLWEPNEERFNKIGFKGIIDYIHSKGMRAGVWFEFEAISEKCISLLGDDVVLKRNGKIVAPYRPIANFRSEKLQEHLFSAVKRMYELGIRYIKNDHNNTAYIGATNYGKSAGYELYQKHLAILEFVDRLKESFPDLIIENCSSGGMREDWSTLSHFDIQSTSDQENYLYYTSILSGSLAYIPAEKAGIWAYPYPQLFEDREKDELDKEYLEKFKSGTETVYNLVNALSGNMYLSGRIDLMDKLNLDLLKEGIKVYKQMRETIKNCYPVYPLGTIRMSYEGIYAFGQKYEGGMYLYAFNIMDAVGVKKIDLTKYQMKNAKILYPNKDSGVEFKLDNNILEISFSKSFSAVVLKFDK